MKSEILSYRKTVPANGEITLKERIKDNGMIANVSIRFYPGAELALRVQPYVLHKNDRREDVITYVDGSDLFVSGDDDVFSFPIQVDVEYDDQFVVYAKNTGGFDYSLSVDVQIKYFSEEGAM